MSAKKGFVYPSDGNKITALNAKWYYNWSLTPTLNVMDIPFSHMCWSGNRVKSLSLAQVDSVLLGFNEPDSPQQSNMTVDDAIALWPQLENAGYSRLGSPATAGNPTDSNGWLAQFMTKAKAANLRVDFIAVHWYAPPNPTSFLNEIDAIYNLYKLPIWITEFSPADWKASTTVPTKFTSNDAIAFMKVVLPALDSRPYVEKYCWKTRPTSDINLGFAALFNDDGSLTDVGKSYATH
jgi:hypothetical protein